MCLIRNSDNLIAREDIKVYKILEACDGRIITPFRRKIVDKNGVIIPDRPFPSVEVLIDGGAIHSYSEFDVNRKTLYPNEFLCEAIIPKNSLYVTGRDNDIASSKLIITKIINTKKVSKTQIEIVNNYFNFVKETSNVNYKLEKMKNQVLTIGQMKVLKELGVDINYSSLVWRYPINKPEEADLTLTEDIKSLREMDSTFDLICEYIPTFTVMDLINLLPEEIDKGYELSISKCRGSEVFYSKLYYDEIDVKFRNCADNLIDALYEMVIFLIKNKYLNHE